MTNCNMSGEERERKRLLSIASRAPLIPGTIVSKSGDAVDITAFFDVETSPIDPQLEKAQTTRPFVRDTVILQDGRTCSLLDLLQALVDMIKDAGEVFTEELRLTAIDLTEEDWYGSTRNR